MQIQQLTYFVAIAEQGSYQQGRGEAVSSRSPI